jgi:hypothetical protein
MVPCGMDVQKSREVCAAESGYLILNALRGTPKLVQLRCFIQRLSGSKHGSKKVRARSVTHL